VNHKVEIEVI